MPGPPCAAALCVLHHREPSTPFLNLRLSERALPGEPGLLRWRAGALRARADAQGRVAVRGE
jgi:hypothetical protein